MNLEYAMKIIQRTSVPPNEIESQLIEAFPQKRAHILRALAMIREGLDVLSSLGQRFSIVEYKTPPLRFPQMLYKSPDLTMTVESEGALNKAISDGWAER